MSSSAKHLSVTLRALGGGNWDARILVEGKRVPYGAEVERPIVFLSPQRALAEIEVGDPLRLWNGGDVGVGALSMIYFDRR
jgi:hypothetical protein